MAAHIVFLLVLAFSSFQLILIKAEQYVMHIEEKGTKFDEYIDVDQDKGVETFKVPSHNNLVGADFLNDFNLGLTATRMPAQKACYISDLNPEVPRPEKLKKDLERASDPRTEKRPSKTIHLKWLIQGDVNRRGLPQSFLDFCGKLPMYKAALLSGNSTGSQSLRQKRSKAVESTRFCNADNKVRFIATCMDAPVWDLRCKFKDSCGFYFVVCKYLPPFDWICDKTRVINSVQLCCDYICQ